MIEAVQTPQGDVTFVFQTSLDYARVRPLWEETLQLLNKHHVQSLILDFRNVETVDSAGIAFLRNVQRHCSHHGIECRYESVPPSLRNFLRYVESDSRPPVKEEPRSFLLNAVTRLGNLCLDKWRDGHDLIQFIGAFLLSFLGGLRHIRRFRLRESTYYAQLAGADAVPIVALMSFLMGLIMAFQAAVQLRQFGANIFVADLVSLAFVRELGPFLTAVILAGRSGAAFAAEIGTMKVNQELDALTVMGFDIMEYLVIPKVNALVFVSPLLSLLANAAGIFGGIVVGIISLDLTAISFLEEAYTVLTLRDLFSGLIKSVVFALLIALIGCFRGFQTQKAAESVGRQTTSAVVSGILLIIIADAVFTVIFHIFEW